MLCKIILKHEVQQSVRGSSVGNDPGGMQIVLPILLLEWLYTIKFHEV